MAEFIGDSDFIACDLLAASGGKATVSLGQNIVFDQIPVHGEAAPGKKAALMLRPERLQLSRNRPGSYAGFQATVSDITFLGNNVHVVAHTGSGEPFAVRLPFGHEAISGLNRGDLVHLAFDPASAQVFC
ncbi:TOBE domain protein [compost metagenome]